MPSKRFVPDQDTAWLALAEIARRGSEDWLRAAAHCGSARELFRADTHELRQAGLGADAAARLRGFCDWEQLNQRREACERAAISIVSIAEPDYPASLRRIPDPPVLLYYRGRGPGVYDAGIAVVGARRASNYGVRMAWAIARRISRGCPAVVSGLAYGIDRAAHEGALEAGASVAVLAGGLDRVYPQKHRALFERLVAEHCVISEYPPGIAALPRHFPVRNRIITGMTRATVVVEAGMRSGSLVSARCALEQGRDVYAVPGNADSPMSRGTNALLREGAGLLACARDVDEAFGLAGLDGLNGPEGRARARPRAADKDPGLEAVWQALQSEPRHIDEIVTAVGLAGPRVCELLTTLEIQGFAACAGPGMFTASNPRS